MTIRRREAKSGKRWDVEWLLPDGTKRSKTFTTLRAAKLFDGELRSARQDGETITNGQGEIEDRGIITDPGPPGNRARCRTCAASSPLCPLYGPIAHPDASGSKRPLIAQCLGFVNIENDFFVPI